MSLGALVHFHALPARKQKVIPALIAQATTKAAARDVGINEHTLIKWLKDPAFEAAYREARYVVMDEAFTLLQKACKKAVETIITVMEDPETNGFVRLQAAQAVLENATKSRQIVELEARIAALERAEHPVDPAQAA